MNHIIEKKYCDIIFQNENYLQMFDIMFQIIMKYQIETWLIVGT